MFLDIEASRLNKEPDYKVIEEIASECFMPLGYGGGITNIEQVKKIIGIGVEKIVLNASAYLYPKLIPEIANIFGSQAVVVSIDVKKDLFQRTKCYTHNGKNKIKHTIVDYAKSLEARGAGEIILTSIQREGSFSGYDIELIKQISEEVNIPLVANGGASKIEDFTEAIINGASAVAAGSFFVYKGSNKGVLINYPTQIELKEKLFKKLS